MKTRFFNYLVGIFCCITLIFSCIQPEKGFSEDVYVEVSEAEVTATRAGEDRLISVETNATDWSFVSSQEGKWLTLSKEDNNLRIVVDENLSATKRSAIVIVAAGEIQKEIIVTQQSADITLELIGGKDGVAEITGISATGDTRRVDFYANTQDVEVEVTEGANWLIIKDKDENGLVVEIKENPDRLARVAKVIVRSGNTSQTLVVKQNGTLFYVLPILGKQVSLNQMFTQEKQRGSTINRIPTDRTQQNIYRLNVASPIADLAQYQYDTPNQTLYNEAFIRYKDRKYVFNNPEFDEFMVEMGFPDKGVDPTGRYIQYSQDKNSETALIARLYDFGEGSGAAVFLSEGTQQVSDQPTFDVVPLLEEMEWLGGEPLFPEENKNTIIREPIPGKIKIGYTYSGSNKGKYTEGGIFDREMKKGSEFDKNSFYKDVDVQWYNFIRKDDSPVVTIEYSGVTEYDYEGIFVNGYAPYSNYDKYKHLLDDAWRIMARLDGRHFSKIFYETRSLEVGLTKEFIKLMEDNGFKHTAEEEGFYFFFKKRRNQDGTIDFWSVVIAETDNYQVEFDIQRNNRANLVDGAEMLAIKNRDFAAYDKAKAQKKAYIEELKKRFKNKKRR